jgi:hypothetical protein
VIAGSPLFFFSFVSFFSFRSQLPQLLVVPATVAFLGVPVEGIALLRLSWSIARSARARAACIRMSHAV